MRDIDVNDIDLYFSELLLSVFSNLYRGETNTSCRPFETSAWWNEALNINVNPANRSPAISFKNRDCNLFENFVRFLINGFTPSISILISGICGERGDVNLGIPKSSLVNTLENCFKTLLTVVPFSGSGATSIVLIHEKNRLWFLNYILGTL